MKNQIVDVNLFDSINIFEIKPLTSQADLQPTDRAMVEMHDWCQRQGDIVVLKRDNLILACEPHSRAVQNCKVVMLNKGIAPGRVLPASQELINMLLANIEVQQEISHEVLDPAAISAQQQRLRLLVKEAIDTQASDIHIEVREDVALIRFRKHGELYLHAEWLPRLAREIASVAFNKETDHATTHFNPMIPQDASMPLYVDGVDVRLRLASLPAHGGFDMVMRILTVGKEHAPTLQELGYLDEQIAIIERASQMPHGAIIVSGPTGSGKTTTLASCLQMIHSERKTYTIEDPVEKLVSNATQVSINSDKDDRSFASLGRAALRMDPDVIVLGEIRDGDTAKVMTRAAITGHLVFSTLHTNSAPNIITRLVDMGISSSLLSDSNLLVCLICQRLALRLCQHCSIPVTDSAIHHIYLSRWREVFGDNMQQVRARGRRNCAHCDNTGIAGRTVVAEIIWLDEAGRHFIQQGDTLGWESYLRDNGWVSYQERTLQLVAQGQCDPLDAEKIVGAINSTFSRKQFNYRQVHLDEAATAKVAEVAQVKSNPDKPDTIPSW